MPRIIRCARSAFGDVAAVLSDMEKVLMSGRLMLGEYLERFEREFAEYVGRRYAIGVSSCTAALEIVLRYVGVDEGEVVIPTSTFIATANAVVYAGGRPVLTDIGPATLALDVPNLLGALSERTRAVIVVHLAGLIAPEIERMRSICAERAIPLIEDCAHAHGARLGGVRAGAFGLAGCFSFYPTKLMTTGTGGMITTNDGGLDEFARSARLHGRGQGDRGGLDDIVEMGNDWFLDEVRSVLGVHQLRELDGNLARRRSLVDRYLERLGGVPDIVPIRPAPDCEPSYYKFMVLFESRVDVQDLRRRLWDRHGIETESLYFPPCHLQPVYRRRFGYREGMLPVAEITLRRQLCLPLHGSLSPDDVDYVVECLGEELAR